MKLKGKVTTPLKCMRCKELLNVPSQCDEGSVQIQERADANRRVAPSHSPKLNNWTCKMSSINKLGTAAFAGLIGLSMTLSGVVGIAIGYYRGVAVSDQELDRLVADMELAQNEFRDTMSSERKKRSAIEKSLKSSIISMEANVALLEKKHAEELMFAADSFINAKLLEGKLSNATKESNARIEAIRIERDNYKKELDGKTLQVKAIINKRTEDNKIKIDSENKRQQDRILASEEAMRRLKEYYLTTINPDHRVDIQSAVSTLNQLNAMQMASERVDLSKLYQRGIRECPIIIRIAGDIIPKGSTYTLAESWQYALSEK